MAGLVDSNLDPFHYYFYGPNRVAPQIFDLEGQKERRLKGQEELFQSDTLEDSDEPEAACEPTADDRRRAAERDAMLRSMGGDVDRFSAAMLAKVSAEFLGQREGQLPLGDYNRRQGAGQSRPTPGANRRGPTQAAQKPRRRGFWRGFVDAMRSDPGAP